MRRAQLKLAFRREMIERARQERTAADRSESAEPNMAGAEVGGGDKRMREERREEMRRLESLGKAARKAEAKVRAAIEETGCPQPLGVVVTSASKKVGRAAAWRLMRRLVLGSES